LRQRAILRRAHQQLDALRLGCELPIHIGFTIRDHKDLHGLAQLCRGNRRAIEPTLRFLVRHLALFFWRQCRVGVRPDAGIDHTQYCLAPDIDRHHGWMKNPSAARQRRSRPAKLTCVVSCAASTRRPRQASAVRAAAVRMISATGAQHTFQRQRPHAGRHQKNQSSQPPATSQPLLVPRPTESVATTCRQRCVNAVERGPGAEPLAFLCR
jgi:hypothetical protein